jgi:hypothetical protein
MEFGNIFDDRKRIPYDDFAIVQRWTFAGREKRNISARVFSCAMGITISSNAMPKWRIKIHGRNDQDE